MKQMKTCRMLRADGRFCDRNSRRQRSYYVLHADCRR
ncbi:hypothetical protein RUMGNA_01257 [Mediterraneibacter gnavus ATCC 29149]|uniref:Uncharacterized protein n=1 Tax=Mediterraneibacter gnavus (strain ATCC 29149 / DSM 114966 / JCM 6515 / VPI C7-9) TaxID=411470 RepID=A7B131_MEDG7|nr:hypothetical protein RUMGNA_01257 [Mediterraneibacter gnavus ATCC 29149]